MNGRPRSLTLDGDWKELIPSDLMPQAQNDRHRRRILRLRSQPYAQPCHLFSRLSCSFAAASYSTPQLRLGFFFPSAARASLHSSLPSFLLLVSPPPRLPACALSFLSPHFSPTSLDRVSVHDRHSATMSTELSPAQLATTAEHL